MNTSSNTNSARTQAYFTLLVLLAELAHLTWEHFHGGVLSHHLLNNKELPALSNAWGALLLPALAWFLFGLVAPRISGGVIAAFLGAILYGALFSAAFATDQEALLPYLFFGLPLIGLVLPIYRGEYLLGFVLGMTFTFGAVLPMLVGSVVAAWSALFHLVIRRIFVQALVWFRRMQT